MKFFVLFIDFKSNIFSYLNMLIKYRSGVVRSSRNTTCISRTGIVVSRSIVHMRSSFTFKQQRIFKWRPTIYVNPSMQAVDIIGENGIITLENYNPIFQTSALGMINFS